MRTLALLPVALLPFVLGNTDCGAPAAASELPEETDFSDGDSSSQADPAMDDCFPIRPLRCGDVVEANTANPNAGTTDIIDGWPIAVGNYSGPEIAWVIDAEDDGTLDVALLDAAPTLVNHDLFLLDAALGCRAEAAIATGFNALTAEVEAGHRYYVVVDGYAGDAGPVTTSIECDEGVADPYPPVELPPSDEAEECAFGEDALETEVADWLTREEMVEQHAGPESMSPLRRDQLRAGWGEATNTNDPVHIPFDIAGPEGIWVDTVTLDATGEAFTWIRFLQDGFIPWGWLFRAGTTELVAYDLDTGWMSCTVERP